MTSAGLEGGHRARALAETQHLHLALTQAAGWCLGLAGGQSGGRPNSLINGSGQGVLGLPPLRCGYVVRWAYQPEEPKIYLPVPSLLTFAFCRSFLYIFLEML